MSRKASDWEFRNRAWLFGMVFAVSFPMYAVDPQNVTASLAKWLGGALGRNPDALVRVLFFAATGLLMLAAFLRTWASSYLHAGVVYASEVKTESLVADGPYRRLRNPLYLANLLMIIGMGSMMSRLGFAVAVFLIALFCYRLILREEGELQAGQSASYDAYRKAVPRIWPTLTPRIPASGRRAKWANGLIAELWYWGFAAGLLVFAITLSQKYFFIILGTSVGLFFLSSMLASGNLRT